MSLVTTSASAIADAPSNEKIRCFNSSYARRREAQAGKMAEETRRRQQKQQQQNQQTETHQIQHQAQIQMQDKQGRSTPLTARGYLIALVQDNDQLRALGE